MSDIAAPWIISEGLAGLRAQALGLAEAAGLTPEIRELKPAAPWKWIAAKLWPNPLTAVADAVKAPLPALAIGCGGMAGAVLAALRRQSMRVVQVQNPRMDINRFDLVIANHHDELTGPNVFVVRTALHRVTPGRLAEAEDAWRDRLAPYRRPLVAVLLGGNNGRFRLDRDAGARLAADLATMAQRDKVGVVVTPSRRTDPAVTELIRTALAPVGGWVWNFDGRKPLFRDAGAGRPDRRHPGQRVDDLRGGGDDGPRDGCAVAWPLAAAGAVPEAADATKTVSARSRAVFRRGR